MTQEQIVARVAGIQGLHDLRLIHIGNLLRSSFQRGSGLAVEVLDGNRVGSSRNGVRGAVLSWPLQDACEPGLPSACRNRCVRSSSMEACLPPIAPWWRP
jgi:hypothetical protein